MKKKISKLHLTDAKSLQGAELHRLALKLAITATIVKICA